MANYQQLKAAIDQVIKANGQKEITGPVLNDTLKAIVNSLGAGYQFRGVATPSTNPGTTDQNVFYIAGQAGTYVNFNSIVLLDGVSILKWNGSWSSETVVAGDGVFDISAYKATGGTLATFADLSAALDGGNNIPQTLRKGGMSVKFVQSSDNKYVQYMYMSTITAVADFTNVANWEKTNLAEEVSQLEQKDEYLLSLSKKCQKEFNTTITGADSVYIPVSLERGDICHVKNLSLNSCSVYLRDSSGNIVQTISAGTLLQNESTDFTVNTDDAVEIGGYCSTGYNLEFSIKSPLSLNSLEQEEVNIKNNLKEQYIFKFALGANLTLVSDKFIAPDGTIMSGGGDPFHVSDAYQISPNQKLYIHASALYGNCYYAIYDENNNVLLREAQTGSVYEKQITVIAPENSHHICISWVGGYTISSLSVADMVKNGKSLSDIKWVCFGDSLTEINANAKKKYYNYAEEELGITPLVYGVSGTGYFKNYGAGNNNFLTRIEQLANVDFDIITFFGSFNDLDGGWIGGSIDSTDITQNDICGFINATLNRLYEIKPFVKVGIITPTPWYNSFQLSECSEYATKLKQIAEKRSIPCLDLFRSSNLHPDKENFREEFYNEDGVQDNGTHPNSLGHLRIYPQFREFLKSML